MNIIIVEFVAAQEATEPPMPAASNGEAQALPHWNYEAGEEGPAYWGELDIAYTTCEAGEEQSPIDIEEGEEIEASDLEDITFNYSPSALRLVNNRHTIQVNYDAGSSIEYGGVQYDLLQFHFHHPSEHTVNEESFAMELHLVHRDADGNLAVVGVLLRAANVENLDYGLVLDNAPTDIYEEEVTLDIEINAMNLLPETHAYFTYMGSLTTPPCSEGVRWLVLTEPVEISQLELGEFASLYPTNRRPVQPLGEREVMLDSTSGS